jgi:hypothetical protein
VIAAAVGGSPISGRKLGGLETWKALMIKTGVVYQQVELED